MSKWRTELQARRDKLLLRRRSSRLRVLPSLFLMLSVTACSPTTSNFVRVPATPIPASLLTPCQPSAPPDNPLTFGGAVMWNELLLTDLQNCNTQLDGIRQFEQYQSK